MEKTMVQTPAKKRKASASSLKHDRLSSAAKKNVKSSPTPTKKSTPNSGSKRKRITSQSPATAGRKKRGTGSRYDSSLGLLTRKFLKLLRGAHDGSLDLNATAQELDVQKRRIYDITNVLEGIGLLEKKSKNTIMWKGGGTKVTPEKANKLQQLRLKLQTMKNEEKEIDDSILRVAQELNQAAENRSNRNHAYATSQDLQSLPSFKNERVLAIRAPSGTTLEVPDPYEGGLQAGKRRYQIFLKSPQGGIDVFLVSTENEELPKSGTNTGNGGLGSSSSSKKKINNSVQNSNSRSRTDGEKRKMDDTPVSTALKSGASPAIDMSPGTNSDFPGFNGGLVKLSPLPVTEDYNFTLDDDDGVHEFFLSEKF